MSRYQLTWSNSRGILVAIQPRSEDVLQHAAALVAAYNDPHNAPLLGHTAALTTDDVVSHYAAVANDGGYNFLILGDGALVGDADLRHVAGGAAEIALMVAAPAAQGQGLGTRIATMVTAFGFVALGLDRIYASIVPANAASRRVFAKLGYAIDDSPRARAYADEPDDLVMAIDRATFAHRHPSAVAEIRIAAIEPAGSAG